MAMAEPDPRRNWDSDRHRRQRSKNRVVLGLIGALMVLFFVLTIVRMTPAS
jgi:type IV secretory pathway component VirB8